MTDDEHKTLDEIRAMTADALASAKRTERFLYEPHIEGKPTRAEQIDEWLSTYRAGKLAGKLSLRLAMWITGAIAAVGALWTNLQGFWK